MDVDWEFPVQRDGESARSHDKLNFVLLLEAMSKVLRSAGKTLTVAVGATRYRGDISYDVPGIVRNVDFINLMTYDFSGSWDPKTGMNSPLYGNSGNNVSASVQYWLNHKCPSNKLVVGIPTYGRSFTLHNSSVNGVGAPAGVGINSPLTGQEGTLGYNEIVANGWSTRWDDEQKVPYAINGN